MAYRSRTTQLRDSISMAYMPMRRGCFAWLADIIVLGAIVALVILHARSETIECSWSGPSAACTTVITGPLGMQKKTTVEGIHSLAYRTDKHIGLVTDAKNKDSTSSFGTRDLELWDDETADAVEEFLETRHAPVSRSHGPLHPPMWTAFAMLLVLGYAWSTRPFGFLLTIDPARRLVLLRERGPLFFGRTERYELSRVKTFDVENEDADKHRVRLGLSDGRFLPLTRTFFPGAHHHDFAARAKLALSLAQEDVS